MAHQLTKSQVETSRIKIQLFKSQINKGYKKFTVKTYQISSKTKSHPILYSIINFSFESIIN